MGGLSYSDAGVSIAAGDTLVQCIKPLCKSTEVAGCMGGLGMFGSVFDMKLTGYDDPLLVSGTDGVGTKLLVSLHKEGSYLYTLHKKFSSLSTFAAYQQVIR